MANQASMTDPNQNHTLMGASGTAGTSETRRLVVDDSNNLHVTNMGGFVPTSSYDNIVVTYPSGTSEVYTYNSGTVAVGITTLVYLDANKGTLSTVTKL